MRLADIPFLRLLNQQIGETKFKKPNEIVSWMVAMQAQEFAHAKWAIGLRLPEGIHDAAVEKEFNEGAILRTHLMRPTWHFVTPADIRWMLALTAPRVHAVNAYWYRKFELTASILKRSNDILVKELQGGNQLTRPTLKEALARKKIIADGLRLSYIMMHAELDGIICSGPREGNQFTYALLDERVPPTKSIDRETALATFTTRYFTSRGPATVKDFAYWSGLSLQEIKAGVASVKNQFEKVTINNKEYVMNPATVSGKRNLHTTFLMPDYDEYGMSYKDRSALSISKGNIEPRDGNQEAYSHWIVIDGLISGAWNQTVKSHVIHIEPNFFLSMSKSKHQDVIRAMKRYCSFFGKTWINKLIEKK